MCFLKIWISNTGHTDGSKTWLFLSKGLMESGLHKNMFDMLQKLGLDSSSSKIVTGSDLGESFFRYFNNITN